MKIVFVDVEYLVAYSGFCSLFVRVFRGAELDEGVLFSIVGGGNDDVLESVNQISLPVDRALELIVDYQRKPNGHVSFGVSG